MKREKKQQQPDKGERSLKKEVRGIAQLQNFLLRSSVKHCRHEWHCLGISRIYLRERCSGNLKKKQQQKTKAFSDFCKKKKNK